MSYCTKVISRASRGGGIRLSYDTYADLPDNLPDGTYAWVITATGTWPVNRKRKGLYRYNGTFWERTEVPSEINTKIGDLEDDVLDLQTDVLDLENSSGTSFLSTTEYMNDDYFFYAGGTGTNWFVHRYDRDDGMNKRTATMTNNSSRSTTPDTLSIIEGLTYGT